VTPNLAMPVHDYGKSNITCAIHKEVNKKRQSLLIEAHTSQQLEAIFTGFPGY